MVQKVLRQQGFNRFRSVSVGVELYFIAELLYFPQKISQSAFKGRLAPGDTDSLKDSASFLQVTEDLIFRNHRF